MAKWLLISDMDGTLLDEHHQLPEVTRQALIDFIAAGHHFTVATGRIASSVEQFLPQLPLSLPAICSNGASVYDFSKRRFLFQESLDSTANQLLGELVSRFPEVGVTYVQEGKVHVWHRTAMVDFYLNIEGLAGVEGSSADLLNSLSKVLLTGARHQLELVETWLRSLTGIFTVVFSHQHFLEILPKGVHKARAAQRMIQAEGLLLGDVVNGYKLATIGDNLNDIELLQWAGEQGWAVANSRPEVLQAIGQQAPRNSDNAVGWLINRLLAQET